MAADAPPPRIWSLQDANYNVLGVVTDAGALQERYEYTPYGKRTVFFSPGSNDGSGFAAACMSRRVSVASASQPYGLNDLGHQGLIRDDTTDLIYNRARVLHPVMGMFNQRDAKGYVDGLKLYEYVSSSPYRFVDPSGNRRVYVQMGDPFERHIVIIKKQIIDEFLYTWYSPADGEIECECPAEKPYKPNREMYIGWAHLYATRIEMEFMVYTDNLPEDGIVPAANQPLTDLALIGRLEVGDAFVSDAGVNVTVIEDWAGNNDPFCSTPEAIAKLQAEEDAKLRAFHARLNDHADALSDVAESIVDQLDYSRFIPLMDGSFDQDPGEKPDWL